MGTGKLLAQKEYNFDLKPQPSGNFMPDMYFPLNFFDF